MLRKAGRRRKHRADRDSLSQRVSLLPSDRSPRVRPRPGDLSLPPSDPRRRQANR